MVLRLLLLSTKKLKLQLSLLVEEEEIVVVATTVHQSKLMLFLFFVLSKMMSKLKRFSTDLAEERSNFLVNRRNVLVEMCTLREQQVTQNTLIFLDFLVNSSNVLLQTALRCRQIVAQFTSKTNKLVNRPNVLSKSALRRQLDATFQTRKLLLHVNGDNVRMQTTRTGVRLITILALNSFVLFFELEKIRHFLR